MYFSLCFLSLLGQPDLRLTTCYEGRRLLFPLCKSSSQVLAAVFASYLLETNFTSVQQLHLENNPDMPLTLLLENISFNQKLSLLMLQLAVNHLANHTEELFA